MSEVPRMTNLEIYRNRIIGLAVISAAPIIAVAPYLIALVGSALTPGCTNEANCSWAALPWFMLLTIPIGIIVAIAGLVFFIIALFQRLRKNSDKSNREKWRRRYYFSWLLTAFGPLSLFLVQTNLESAIRLIYTTTGLILLAVILWNLLEKYLAVPAKRDGTSK
jgi:MFS family permease